MPNRRGAPRVPSLVPSTVIRSFDYRPDARELEVTFTTGRRYLYAEVPPEAAQAPRGAFAKGRHFNARIRGRYPFVELEGTQPEDREAVAEGSERRSET